MIRVKPEQRTKRNVGSLKMCVCVYVHFQCVSVKIYFCGGSGWFYFTNDKRTIFI